MRLDLLLVRLRFARSRSIAQRWIGEGHFRLGGQRVTAADTKIGKSDVITMPMRSGPLVVMIDALPDRRGPPNEARSCYHTLDDGEMIAIANMRRDQSGKKTEGNAP